ncbi:ECF RNA polymerase sigma factor SigK [anaerobic digester metagenome]
MVSYAAGDMEAFEELYGRHKSRVFGFLMGKLKDRSEAEDTFQAIFAKLHQNRHRYRQDIPFLPWLFTISRNTLIDHVRKKAARRKFVTDSEYPVDSYADPGPGLGSMDEVLSELAGLSESQRQALELRFSQGLTFAEIAERMQTSADNSRQIISRAVRKLRSLIAGKGGKHEQE